MSSLVILAASVFKILCIVLELRGGLGGLAPLVQALPSDLHCALAIRPPENSLIIRPLIVRINRQMKSRENSTPLPPAPRLPTVGVGNDSSRER